ncbi:class I SAM-dependent methyltransferase [Arsukibacterium sp.]|uniref:class I SAM-dependent methyltransferase n=1 Tax=Arsukibacterium sp. TaxID=1977258 RepID=UPI002FDAF410
MSIFTKLQPVAPNHLCPLCDATAIHWFSEDARRVYYQCQQCQLVFADRLSLLSPDAELAQYQLHNNDIADSGYRAFLSRLATPLLQHLPGTGLQGLDFGCGPGPLLAQILTEAGHKMHIWDPFFANQPAVLQQQYDFICCTEAIEHFISPSVEWQLWQQLLKPQAILAIMTKRYTDAIAFAGWHYKNDPTHVSFFAEYTFAWLAQRDGLIVRYMANDVVLLQKAG